MGGVVTFTEDQTRSMLAHARMLRRGAIACVAGAVLAAATAPTLGSRCAVAVSLSVVGAMLVRRARWVERLSLESIFIYGRRRPEGPPSERDREGLARAATYKPGQWKRTLRR